MASPFLPSRVAELLEVPSAAKTAVSCGVGYVLFSCFVSGTAQPDLNFWFLRHWASEYAQNIIAHWKSAGLAGLRKGLGSFWALHRLHRLETDHQRFVKKAGGHDAVKEDPTRIWKLGLSHVKSARNSEKDKAKGKGMDAGPILKELVLVGGGHTHVHVLLMLGMEPIEGVRVTLITRDMDTPYSGMLPGHVAGHYTKDECHIDLMRLGRFANARVVHAEVQGIDMDAKKIRLRSCLDDSGERPAMRYDVLSINVGCSPSVVGGLSGYEASASLGEHVTTVKPIDGFSAKWERIVGNVKTWTGPKVFLIVGAGAGGVELALSMQHRLQMELRALGLPESWIQMKIATRGRGLLPIHGGPTQQMFEDVLAERGVEVLREHEAVGVNGDGTLQCRNSQGVFAVRFDECIWCTNAAPQSWVKELNVDKDEGGFLLVDQTMQVLRNGQVVDEVFAAGDTASIRDYPRPKAGVFAVMAGMPLSKNLRTVFEGGVLAKYTPQKLFIAIIGTGRGAAVASIGDVALRADWLWELKDWIDRTWMWKYTYGLPKMEAVIPPPGKVAVKAGAEAIELLQKATMRCGGCGSKVGATVLSSSMHRLQGESGIFKNEEVLVGVDAPDDCAVVRQKGSQLVTAQSVDYFKSFIGDPYVFGRCAALHALSDTFAMGARAQTALAMVTVPLASEEVMQEDLFQMMAGANQELRAARCTLAGGHTVEGPEAGLGFCVTGVAEDSDKLMTKGGMRPSDVLILTKPIGTGCIFAAEMRTEARGRWVSAALSTMLQSNEPAAQLCLAHGATSCTDVTGFGLLGHLAEMCKASAGVACKLVIADVPILDGAQELVDRGITSSLQPANFRLRRAVFNEVEVSQSFAAGRLGKYPLLFDPQTNGGILASVPATALRACKDDFKRKGLSCWEVGVVIARPDDWETGRYVGIEISP